MTHCFLVTIFTLSACATSFTGDSKVPGGPQACAATCNAWQMDLAGMFSAGEYSDGCICRVRSAPAPPAGPAPGAAAGAQDVDVVTATAAAVPALVGVELQKRQEDEQRRRTYRR
jgi:hypothetical protein